METSAGRSPLLDVTWNDPVTGCRGYVVIDTLVRGVAGGGLRMRKGCTREEVAALARAMSLKEAVSYRPGTRYVPVGGAKGGIDFDPRHPDARAVLRRFAEALRAIITAHWATGEDLGLAQSTIDTVFAEAGVGSSVQAILAHVDDPAEGLRRLAAAFGAEVESMPLPQLVGGVGVAECTVTALRHRGVDPGEMTAAVQGFGSMGGGSALELTRQGVRVVAVADVDGVVTNPDGLDVAALLAARDEHGTIDRAALRPGDEQLPGEAWAGLDVDVLVPAALAYALNGGNVDEVRASLIVEAANIPTTSEAEARLADRGVAVLPDFVANSSANVWWWWTLFGDIEPTPESAYGLITTHLRELTLRVLDRARDDAATPRAAATRIAGENLALLTADAGS
jgi:glutamate dehydrogenase (NAD(P)+)